MPACSGNGWAAIPCARRGRPAAGDATQALRTRLGARYVYAAGDQTRSAGAAWEQDARTEARAARWRPAGADTNGGATVLEAGARWEPSPSWSLRLSAQGQFGARQGIGERLSSIALLRRDAGSAQVGRWASTVSRICITYSPQSCHEGRGPGRISLDQPRDSALTPLTSSRISAGNAAASGSVSGVSRDGKRSVMERDGADGRRDNPASPPDYPARLLPIIAGLALAGPLAQGIDELGADIAVHLAVDDDAVLHRITTLHSYTLVRLP